VFCFVLGQFIGWRVA